MMPLIPPDTGPTSTGFSKQERVFVLIQSTRQRTQHALIRSGHAIGLRGRNKETERNKLPPQ
jgi:hypothetical protein